MTGCSRIAAERLQAARCGTEDRWRPHMWWSSRSPSQLSNSPMMPLFMRLGSDDAAVSDHDLTASADHGLRPRANCRTPVLPALAAGQLGEAQILMQCGRGRPAVHHPAGLIGDVTLREDASAKPVSSGGRQRLASLDVIARNEETIGEPMLLYGFPGGRP